MSVEIAPPPDFTAWGPFVGPNYRILRVTRLDLIVAGTAFALASIFALSATYIAFRQTKARRHPRWSGYIWMIWLELLASVALAILCLLFLIRIVRPSFYFYIGVLLCWAVQIQLLLQIIVNRICIIMQDRKRGRQLMIFAGVSVLLINLSVFVIWIPARLQVSPRWIRINAVWDRIEKVLYLFLDIYLNVYFIRAVNANLVGNGLKKYRRLVRFNKRIIVVSLLMDVMIIVSMSVPNGFVYAMFHPLAYLVKLNIEMSMAHLIRMIALGNRLGVADPAPYLAFPSSPDSAIFHSELLFADVPWPRHSLIRGVFGRNRHNRVVARKPVGSFVRSTSMPEHEMRPQKRTNNEAPLPRIGSNHYSDGSAKDNVSEGHGRVGVLDNAGSREAVIAPRPVFLSCRWSDPG